MTAHCRIMIIDFISGIYVQELEYKNDTIEQYKNNITTLTLLNNNKLVAAMTEGILLFDIKLTNQ